MKTCIKCRIKKELVDFYAAGKHKDGYQSICKPCHKAYYKIYRVNNRKKRRAYNDQWNSANITKFRQTQKRANDKKRTTPKGRLNSNIGSAISNSLRGEKHGRRWQDLVGYSIDELKTHLEKKFLPGMTWGNYGNWHVDHKVPISVHNFASPEDIDFKKCWALKNLQPMWEKENVSKKDKLIKPFQPSLTI
jgi:5-methylcytosine-specific restriction endonuclease McrA